MSCGIYKIENLCNGKKYIGQSNNIERRFIHHKLYAFNEKSETYNYPIYAAIRKYGMDNFLFDIIEECSKENLNEREIYYIKTINTLAPKGYNQTLGGQNPHISKLTPDIVEDITFELFNGDIEQKILAEKYNVHYTTICDINIGKTWHRDIVYPIRKREHNIEYCPICGEPKTISSEKCNKCRHIDCRTVERPEALELAKMICETSFTAVGLKYGVSDNSIKKWCKSYGIPHLKQELKEWYKKQ